MYDIFLSKLNPSLKIPHYLVNWLDLSTKIKFRFDTVLCRGNSLIYVDSWDKNKIPEQTKENIKKSLQEFYNILNENGLLYIDITNKSEFDKEKYPIIEEFGEKEINGNKVKLTWELNHNYKNKLRTCKATIKINNQEYEYIFYSFLLRHKELTELLKDVGFKKVEETKIDGENNYNVFIAYK